MYKIEVCLTPQLFDKYTTNNKIIVIVDIFRATSIITTMFHKGLKKLIPAKDLNEAKIYKEKGYLVAAERNGRKVDFADFDNSPFSFTRSMIEGKTIVYCTTNGTNTINLSKNSGHVIIASFLNLSAIANYLIKQKKDIVILCSGWNSTFCLEDTLFAGALADKLVTSKNYETECDSTFSSIDLWNIAKSNLLKYIEKSFQYKRLKGLGFDRIINYCFQRDLTNIIPVLKEDYIIDSKAI